MIRIVSAVLCLSAALLPSAATAQDNAVKGVSRVMLGSGLPAAAPGQELSLRRVTVQPKASVPGEVHSGMQVVYIVSGRLSLQVMGGVAVVRRARPDGSMSEPVQIKAGPTPVILSAGDTVLETETLVLHPSNPGDEPTVILAGSLLAVGKPQSIPITETIRVP
jgi:hypothetical protein